MPSPANEGDRHHARLSIAPEFFPEENSPRPASCAGSHTAALLAHGPEQEGLETVEVVGVEQVHAGTEFLPPHLFPVRGSPEPDFTAVFVGPADDVA